MNRSKTPRTFSRTSIWPLLSCTLLLSLGLLTTGLSADELRLKDGRRLYGDVTERGTTFLIETESGREVVDKDLVVARRTDDELRAELAELEALANGRPESWIEVARRAKRFRLSDELWAALEQSALRDPTGRYDDHRHRLLASLESEFLPPHQRRRDPEDRIRQLTLRIRKHRTDIELEALSAILSTFTDSSDQLWHKVRIATNPLQRRVLLDALWSMSEGGDDEQSLQNRRFVYRRAMFERNEKVRSSVVENLHDHEEAREAVDYVASALGHRRLDLRLKSAETLGVIGTPEAAEALIAAAPSAAAAAPAAGSAPRAYFASIEQRAFVRDFDVEVAQAAAVANPVVGTLQSGVVLEVAIIGSFEIRQQLVSAYRRALRRIAGSDPGPSVAAWEQWWQDIEAQRAAAEERRKAAEKDGKGESPDDGGIWKR